MDIDLPPLHDDLIFNAPLSLERARRLAGFAVGAAGYPRHVLDIGCGWAELLLLVLELDALVTATGVDVDAQALAHARSRAAERGVLDRLTLLEGPGTDLARGPVDAVVSVGARHVWGEDDTAALTGLRMLVEPGGRVVYGDGIWRRPPTPPAVDALGGDPKAYAVLADVVEAAVAAGFRVLDVAEASLEEWDSFESGYSAGYERWLLSHPGHPAAGEIETRAAEHRLRYLRGYRDVLGHCTGAQDSVREKAFPACC